ncbi:hypothetical protein BJ508DRAFT_336310 [Ascobolus immersus RN42]|uniref:Uncharacterized protein n=1 Tax=Ascobolus immersus RN42 TaxID=1160509 RepID=A0A3N4HNG2_ASCIM|nr:hypothetical protein BJ508DRAFT_336310 [Ascobolus immersus RN42]
MPEEPAIGLADPRLHWYCRIMLENNVREKQHGAYYNIVQNRLAPFQHSMESLAALARNYTADLPALRLLEEFPDIGFGCGGRSIPIEMIERAHEEGGIPVLGPKTKLRRPPGFHQTGATPPGPIPPNLLISSIQGASRLVFLDLPSAQQHQQLSQAQAHFVRSALNEDPKSHSTPERQPHPTPSTGPTAKPTCSGIPGVSEPSLQSTEENQEAPLNDASSKRKPSLIVTLHLPRHRGVLKKLDEVATLIRTNRKFTETNLEFHLKRKEARARRTGWTATPHISGLLPLEHPAEGEVDGLARDPLRKASQVFTQPLSSASTGSFVQRGTERETATLLRSAVNALRKSTADYTAVTSRTIRSRSGKRATVGRGPVTVAPSGSVGWKP